MYITLAAWPRAGIIESDRSFPPLSVCVPAASSLTPVTNLTLTPDRQTARASLTHSPAGGRVIYNCQPAAPVYPLSLQYSSFELSRGLLVCHKKCSIA